MTQSCKESANAAISSTAQSMYSAAGSKSREQEKKALGGGHHPKDPAYYINC